MPLSTSLLSKLPLSKLPLSKLPLSKLSLSNLPFGWSANDDGQRFFAPEVIQTSAMDCGPAALSCLLTGFDIPVSYGRLREACQTDVDGTSINMIEDMAQALGLQANQVIAPVDHLTLPAASLLPALVVTVLPGGIPHFVVVWNVIGPFVQVMNPAVGRQWIRKERFQRELYRYATPFPAMVWRQWAASEGFCGPLRSRLAQLEISSALQDELLSEAIASPSWRPLATLDAATRFVQSLVTARGAYVGPESESLLQSLVAESAAVQDPTQAESLIPPSFWSVRRLAMPADASTNLAESESAPAHPELTDVLIFHGAVLMQVQGREGDGETGRHGDTERGRQEDTETGRQEETSSEGDLNEAIAPELVDDEAGSLSSQSGEADSRVLQFQDLAEDYPEWTIWQTLRADGLTAVWVLLLATTIGAGAVTLEAALLRGLMTVAEPLVLAGQNAILIGLCLFIGLLLLLEWPLANTVQRVGRRLELQLRIKLLAKIPRLSDRYFHSRLVSDMAERAHSLQTFHGLPDLAVRAVRLTAQLLFTAGGIIWLYPGSAPLVITMVVLTLVLLVITQPLLAERDMRVRTHTGALSRFYLDALLGLMPIRTHSASRAVRREHEGRLVEWVRASRELHWIQRTIQSVGNLVSMGFAVAIVFHYIRSGGEASVVLLLLYWTLNLPALSQLLFSTIQQYPVQRNRLARLLEPLSVPDEKEGERETEREGDGERGRQEETRLSAQPLALSLKDVTVRAGGHVLLDEINLEIEPGEHVAIVGASGAGKSTLAGLLLGWHRPATGSVLVDGKPLIDDHLQAVRRQTAWVDPSVQLWNRTFLENILYGAEDDSATGIDNLGEDGGLNLGAGLDDALELAHLYPLLDHLPSGLHTALGENGGLVSGGEGQRVRLGRALLRSNVCLAILDEPFRGLDRTTRRELLKNARTHWQSATLLCITHDIGSTQGFDRVLVIENGHIVEDDTPTALLAESTSRYRNLLSAEESVQRTMWEGTAWRHLWMEDGILLSDAAEQDKAPLYGR